MLGEDALTLDLPVIRSFRDKEIEVLFKAWKNGINSPWSSSAGRLFDALASILDIRQVLNYEGQAAMMIEDCYDDLTKGTYEFTMSNGIIDWRPLFQEVLKDRENRKIPSRFINTLAAIILRVATDAGYGTVCLSGGVFQNAPLTQKVTELLSTEFNIHTHKKIPCNDGGISLGQAVFGGLTEAVKREA
jgi:hydrogenase maturation protein HypF